METNLPNDSSGYWQNGTWNPYTYVYNTHSYNIRSAVEDVVDAFSAGLLTYKEARIALQKVAPYIFEDLDEKETQ